MAESRTELIAWVNDLTQLGITKIEQCGTGAVHTVIMDSIYRDVQLHKVKFAAKHEYEYVANFKVLQACFDKHKIDNAIPVERLVKCKFQDNLEFLQWTKKFWDQFYPGGTYDAIARRKGEGMSGSRTGLSAAGAKSTSPRNSSSAVGTLKGGSSSTSIHGAGTTATGGARKLSANAPRAAAAAGPNTASGAGVGGTHSVSAAAAMAIAANNHATEQQRAELVSEYQRATNDMLAQINELKGTVDQVEKEREFYFNKLREIELYIQNRLDASTVSGQGLNVELDETLKEVQGIMYKTEEGFEIPETADDAQQTF
ncbi:calponin homology domain-containing protein [Entophlyctis helioformis]|nr:calponin homology domain-containing protein [Entophlyctis helioformis]